MEETLRHYLDRIDIGPGDNSPLVIVVGNTEMNVSRRYLESEPMKHYLDMVIVDYEYPFTDIRGTETIKFWLEEREEELVLKGPKKNWRELRKN